MTFRERLAAGANTAKASAQLAARINRRSVVDRIRDYTPPKRAS